MHCIALHSDTISADLTSDCISAIHIDRQYKFIFRILGPVGLGFFESSPLVPNCVYCSRLFAPDSFEIHAPGPPYIIRVRRNIRNRSLHRQWHRCTSMVIRQITRITPFFKIHVIIYESTPCEWTFGKISLVFSNFTRFAREIRQKLREIYSQSPLTRS